MCNFLYNNNNNSIEILMLMEISPHWKIQLSIIKGRNCKNGINWLGNLKKKSSLRVTFIEIWKLGVDKYWQLKVSGVPNRKYWKVTKSNKTNYFRRKKGQNIEFWRPYQFKSGCTDVSLPHSHKVVDVPFSYKEKLSEIVFAFPKGENLSM